MPIRMACSLVALAACATSAVAPAASQRVKVVTSEGFPLAIDVHVAPDDAHRELVWPAITYVTHLLLATHSVVGIADTSQLTPEIERGVELWLCGKHVTITSLAIEPYGVTDPDLLAKLHVIMNAPNKETYGDALEVLAAGCPQH